MVDKNQLSQILQALVADERYTIVANPQGGGNTAGLQFFVRHRVDPAKDDLQSELAGELTDYRANNLSTWASPEFIDYYNTFMADNPHLQGLREAGWFTAFSLQDAQQFIGLLAKELKS